MKIKTLVISPYEGLAELIRHLAKEQGILEIEVVSGDLQEGVEIAKKMDMNSFDLIISRGGTASMIQEAVSIPVIDIQVSGYDMLRALTLAKNYPGKVAIVGFANISQGATTICGLLDLNVKTFTIHNAAEVYDQLIKLKKEDFQVVIGDVITIETARKVGLEGILLTSGTEAIMAAFEEAKKMHSTYMKIKQKYSLFEKIVKLNEQGIMVFDDHNEIIYQNDCMKNEDFVQLKNSSQLLGIARNALKREQDVVSFIQKKQQVWRITSKVLPPMESKEKRFLAITIQKVFELNSLESSVLTIKYQSGTMKGDDIYRVMGDGFTEKKLRNQINQYAKSAFPLWISGENGTGKEMTAYNIHINSVYKDYPFITVHCGLLVEKELEIILKGLCEGLKDGDCVGTLYFKNINKLSLTDQKSFIFYLENYDNGALRFIVSSIEEIEVLVEKELFNFELYNYLSRLNINITPLRKRQEEIKFLSQRLLADQHAKYSTQVVGIREESLKELILYEWPGNLFQLKNVIEELVVISEGPYIEVDDVIYIIGQIKDRSRRNKLQNELNLEVDLEDIERQVILKILEEEDMNQSRAAKRLGISRSTLWRKLKIIEQFNLETNT